MALSIKKIQRLEKPGRFADGHGLYLQITARGGRSWIFRYQVAGREHAMGLGATYDLSLDDAREAARQARLLLRAGRDPLVEKREAIAANKAARPKDVTFEKAAEQWIDFRCKEWKDPRARQRVTRAFDEYANKIVGQVPVARVTKSHILQILEQQVPAYRDHPAGMLWSARPKTARVLRAHIEAVLSYATTHEWRSGDNPARWADLKNVLSNKTPTVTNYPSMEFGDVPAFLSEVRSKFTVPRRALEFLILTAARSNEVLGMSWDEVDPEAQVWTVPASRMKGGRTHKVPLNKRAVEILDEMPRMTNNDHVFAGSGRSGSISRTAMAEVLATLDRAGVSVHGFRASFKTWSSEETNFARTLVEKALSHRIGANAVEEAYDRGDLLKKRTRLMNVWGAFCMRPVAKDDDVVVPMKKFSAL